jgi:hypothetical protein
MKNHFLRSGFLFGCLLLVLATPALPQGTSSFTTFEVPAAGTGALQGTTVIGIDTAGDVAGTYIDANTVHHGYIRAANGTITTFDVPGSVSTKGYGTFVVAMDPAGDVAGYYTVSQYGQTSGFVRTANGAIFSTFNASSYSDSTLVIGINSLGSITGEAYSVSGFSNSPVGFVGAANGAITTFAAPVPGQPAPDNYNTIGIAINTAGIIAGRYSVYSNSTGLLSHGFIRAANGTINTFDPANVTNSSLGSNTYSNYIGTLPTSIDTAGDIAGTYTDINGARHSFVRLANGVITSFDPPGTDSSPCPFTGNTVVICGSGASAINDAGEIVGVYIDTNNIGHGFLRAANGSITSFDAPGAGTGSYQGTAAFAINAAGTIAGIYLDANSVLHGFVGNAPPTATTTTLTSSQSASVFNEPASFTATVSSNGGTPANGESVYFTNGSTQLGSALLSSGTASFTTTALPVGTDSVTASYAGDTNFAGSTSAAVSQTVGKATSFTTLTSLPNPSALQQPVTLTATVSGQFGGTATGTVTFSNGSAALGTASLSGNSAALSTAALPVGTDSITAVYGGDNNFGASTSNTVSQVVTGPAATPTFSVAAGTYTAAQTVFISDATTGATIYYTTDGKTTPTTGSTLYTGAITVSTTEIIQAIAVASGYSTSAVATATYTIPPRFTVSTAAVAVAPGATTGNTSTITLTPAGGFTGTVALTAAITSSPSGAVQPPILSFGSTTPVSIAGTAAGTATLTISTIAASSGCSATVLREKGIPWYTGGGATLACLLLFGIPARRRGWRTMIGMFVLHAALVGGMTACGGGGGGTKVCSAIAVAGTTPGSYTITVTGTSGTTTSAGTVTLTVQ